MVRFLEDLFIFESPCVEHLYGPNVHVDKMKALVKSYIIICVIVTLLNDNWYF